jgi:hypothetical protein
MKNTVRRLRLSKDTLRHLGRARLSGVAGGGTIDYQTLGCTDGCGIGATVTAPATMCLCAKTGSMVMGCTAAC